MEKHANDHDPFLVEAMPVGPWQCLNGCASLDWTRENCLSRTIRVAAPAFHISYFLTGVYLIVLNQFVLSWPVIFRYSLFLDGGRVQPSDVTLSVCMLLWALEFAFLAAACAGAWSSSTREWWWGWSLIGYRPHHALLVVVYWIVLGTVAAVGTIVTHTALSHMLNTRNVWFAVLLNLQCAMLVVSTLGDALDVGSPWGVQQASRAPRALLILRLVALMPLTITFSIASVFASWPPS